MTQSPVVIPYQYFNKAIDSYLPIIKHQDSLAKVQQTFRYIADGQAKIGLYYLSAIVYEHLLLFVKESEQVCQQALLTLNNRVENSFGIQRQALNRLVYKIFFFENTQLLKGFIEQIRGLLTQIRYAHLFKQQTTQDTKSEVEKQTQSVSNPSLNTTHDDVNIQKTSEHTQSTGKSDQFTEQKSFHINIDDLQIKLHNFCNITSVSHQESVEQYLQEISNARSQMSQLCHQLGFNQCVLTKTAVEKLFRVTCKLDISGNKLITINKQTFYEEYAIDANTKTAATMATYKLLLKLYNQHPAIWQSFKGIKKTKKIKT